MKYVKGCLRRMMSFNFVIIVFVVVIVEMRNIYKGHNELQYCMHCVHVYTVVEDVLQSRSSSEQTNNNP